MIRTGVLRLIRTNVRSFRPISTGLWRASVTNPISTQNFDDILGKDRRPIETFTEDPIVAKKFFVSEVDREQMLYPEVISKDELDSLIEKNHHVADFFDHGIQFDGKGISKLTHDSFKQMNMYGYNIRKEFGGSGYSFTETIMAGEIEAQNINVAITLNAHRLVCEVISEFGTDKQRMEYLPKLAKGDIVATTAFQEWHRAEKGLNKTIVEYDSDKKQWRLNGTKSFVLNAAKSNLFLVSALVPQSNKADSLSIFLVDGNAAGVTVHKKDHTLGHTDVYQADVSFENVSLPLDAILSVPGTGRHIERSVMFQSRLQQSVINLVQMKALAKYMHEMVDTVEQRNRLENPEGLNFEAMSLRVGVSKHASTIYATESMLYMTTGLWDLYKNSNLDVETAITKIYSQESLLSMVMELSNCVDTPVTLDDHPMNHFIRDAVQLQTFGEPKDTLKLYIGIAGIQFSGNRIFEDVKKVRNPFFNPEYALKKFFSEETMDKYESHLNLKEFVVHEFDAPARWLEGSIHRLRIGASDLMSAHGRNLLQEHSEIQRLAEAVIYIFASFSCLSRANRSWILQLQDAPHERILAGCAGDMLMKQTEEIMKTIGEGPNDPIDKHYRTIAKQMIKTKSYFPVHPLTRFF